MSDNSKPERMNPKVKQLWVDALRSGKYKQGRTELKDGDLFCCLGVLCDLHRKHRKSTKFFWDEWGRYNFNGEHTIGEYPPKVVFKWAGIPEELISNRGDVLIAPNTRDGYNKYASERNDISEDSFKQIADLIERNL